MMKRFKGVLEFYATIGIPVLYGINLFLVSRSGNLVTSSLFKLLGLALVILGLVLWILSFVTLGRSFGVLPVVQKKLKKGVYKYFSHPMYMGILMTFLGLGILNESGGGLAFSLVVMLPLLVVRAKLEEKKLV